jgi:glutamate dehydrogenase
MAYAKIALFEDFVASDLAEEAYLHKCLVGYFPALMHDRFAPAIESHPLRREIVATVVANAIVNEGGMAFVSRMMESSGAGASLIAKAFVAACAILGLDEVRARINALDNELVAARQIELHLDVIAVLRRQALWLLHYAARIEEGVPRLPIAETVERYARPMDAVRAVIRRRVAEPAEADAPTDIDRKLARDVALLPWLASAGDIIDAAQAFDKPLELAADIYFELGARLGLDELRQRAAGLGLSEHWERLAASRLLDDLYHHQRALLFSLLPAAGEDASVENIVDALLARVEASFARARTLIAEMELGGGLSVAKLSLATSQIRELVTLASGPR